MWAPDVSAKSTAKRIAAGTFGQKDHKLSLSVIGIHFPIINFVRKVEEKRKFCTVVRAQKLPRRYEILFTKTKNSRLDKGSLIHSPNNKGSHPLRDSQASTAHSLGDDDVSTAGIAHSVCFAISSGAMSKG